MALCSHLLLQTCQVAPRLCSSSTQQTNHGHVHKVLLSHKTHCSGCRTFEQLYCPVSSRTSLSAKGPRQQCEALRRFSRVHRGVQKLKVRRANNAEGPGEIDGSNTDSTTDPQGASSAESAPESRDSESGDEANFASDSTGVTNFQLPKIAVVDEESIGSSRFDVAVRAMKGDFDPPSPKEDTEKRSLLDALVQFPSFYTFSIVGKLDTASKAQGDAFTKDTLETVERLCGTKLASNQYSVTEKMGGKYLSMRVTTLVQSAEIVKATYDELLRDSRVIMAY